MITILKSEPYNFNDDGRDPSKMIVQLELLSTDTKPTDVANGSLALEIDTGDVYAFDEVGEEWNKIVGE